MVCTDQRDVSEGWSLRAQETRRQLLFSIERYWKQKGLSLEGRLGNIIDLTVGDRRHSVGRGLSVPWIYFFLAFRGYPFSILLMFHFIVQTKCFPAYLLSASTFHSIFFVPFSFSGIILWTLRHLWGVRAQTTGTETSLLHSLLNIRFTRQWAWNE